MIATYRPQEKASLDTYVVQRGDTLAGVALRLGMKVSDLKRANRMYGSKTLIMGQASNPINTPLTLRVRSHPCYILTVKYLSRHSLGENHECQCNGVSLRAAQYKIRKIAHPF